MFQERGDYRSDGLTPTLDERLGYAQVLIQRLYKARLAERYGSSFGDFWNATCDWLALPGRSATKLAFLVELPPADHPQPSDALAVAVAFWVEARVALDVDGDRDRSWAALTQCFYYYGMADGPETAQERSSKGGAVQGQSFQPIRDAIVGWLKEYSDGHFPTLTAAIAELAEKAKAFRAEAADDVASPVDRPGRGSREKKEAHGRSTNPARLIRDLRAHDPEVRAETERVVANGIARGRKPGPASKLARTRKS